MNNITNYFQKLKTNYHKETLKTTIDMAWPAIVESFFVAFAGLIDSLMVSSLGSSSVAAVGLTTQPKLLGLALFFALNVAISALVARRRGEQRQDSANEILYTAVLFIIVAAVILSIGFVAFASPIMNFCGSTADTHDGAVAYFRIIMGGMIFNCIQMGINSAQRGAGNTKITMRTNVTSNVINIILNYLLINGHFGFPALGIQGAALATVSGTVVACIMSIASIFKKDNFISIPYIISYKIRPTAAAFLNLIKVGYSVFFEQVTGPHADRLHADCHYGRRPGNRCNGCPSGGNEYHGAVLLLRRRPAIHSSCADRAKPGCRRSGSCQGVRTYLPSHRSLYRGVSGRHLLLWCKRIIPPVFQGRTHCSNRGKHHACDHLCRDLSDLSGHLHGLPAGCR